MNVNLIQGCFGQRNSIKFNLGFAKTLCCGQLWVRLMLCGQTCDELYHFTFYLIVLGYL